MERCAGCGHETLELHPCWFCQRDVLCAACHDDPGHCGEPDAVRANEEARAADTWEGRHAALRRAQRPKKVDS
jgi:hypothetical protein